MTTYLILAQGSGRRWLRQDGTQPLGIPKHIVPVLKQPAIDRIAEQFKHHGRVVVIGPDRYQIDGTELVTSSRPFPTGTSMDKLFATEPYWDTEGRTTILWGDCYYSPEAVAAITACDSPDPHWFRRPGPSGLTGHRWDESFAISFLPEHHIEMIQHAKRVVTEVPASKIHMWNHYASWLGLDPLGKVIQVKSTPHQTHIDDWTDDFDSWEEYTRWLGRFHSNLGIVKPVVCIPWYDGGIERRSMGIDWVTKWWQDIGFEVIFNPSGETRSAARNSVAEVALSEDYNALLFVDADTVTTRDQAWASAALAWETNRYVVMFEEHIRLPRGAYPQVQNRKAGGKIVLNMVAGAFAVSRELWEMVGGFDERFIVWGGEDRAFHYATEALSGPLERIPGRSWHLWHPKDPLITHKGHPDRVAGVELTLRYKEAAGFETVPGSRKRVGPPDREAMLAILREPGGPLAGHEHHVVN